VITLISANITHKITGITPDNSTAVYCYQ